jgi:multidrug efflux system outer membrane protein
MIVVQTHRQIHSTTPAKAGAQLGEVANGALPIIKKTLPAGPRPSPEWRVKYGSSRLDKQAQ